MRIYLGAKTPWQLWPAAGGSSAGCTGRSGQVSLRGFVAVCGHWEQRERILVCPAWAAWTIFAATRTRLGPAAVITSSHHHRSPRPHPGQAPQTGLVASRGLPFLAIPLNMSQCAQTRDWMTVDRLTFNFEKDSLIQFGFHKLHALWEHDCQSETGPSQCHHWLAGSCDPEPQCGWWTWSQATTALNNSTTAPPHGVTLTLITVFCLQGQIGAACRIKPGPWLGRTGFLRARSSMAPILLILSWHAWCNTDVMGSMKPGHESRAFRLILSRLFLITAILIIVIWTKHSEINLPCNKTMQS